MYLPSWHLSRYTRYYAAEKLSPSSTLNRSTITTPDPTGTRTLSQQKAMSSLEKPKLKAMPSNLEFGVISSPADDKPEVKKRRTFREWWNDFLDFEKRAAKREKLVREYKTSYFKDMIDIRNDGEKLWEARRELITPEKALYMPSVHARSLTSGETSLSSLLCGKTTLVSIRFNRFGELQARSFIEPFLAEFSAQRDRVALAEIDVEENLMKVMLVKAFIPYIRWSVPKELRSNRFLLFKNIASLRRALRMTNVYRAYTYLVDLNCKVRWAAHGTATKQEIETMIRLTKALNTKRKG